MKEVLIISYFYTPCSLTAAQRPAGWVKHLSQFGVKPILITRNWDKLLNTPEDQLRDSGKQIKIDKTNSFEIHYLPYRASLRDRLFNSSNTLLKKTSKVFTFLTALGENFSNRFIPFDNIYDYAEVLISKHTFSAIVITGNPFIQFRFGYLLTKKFDIPWIADYRDDWTTSEIISRKGIFAQILFYIQQKTERKWVKTASYITSVSDVYTQRISHFVNVPGTTILNGFDTLLPQIKYEDFSSFVITYNGTLYATQDVEGFIRSVLRCIHLYHKKINIHVRFPGVSYDPIQEKRIKFLIQGYESHFFLSPRIAKNEVIALQQSSDLLLMLTHIGIKGIPSSKLYEYLSLQKTILCYPSDNDIVAETLMDTGLGEIVNNEEELFLYICTCIRMKLNRESTIFEVNTEKLMHYSTQIQVAKLNSLLNNIH